jgi:energy-coupling factor transporter ATP-binding protein EcfA2
MFDKRINIFAGHYGSGKSEIAVNAAVAIRKNRDNVLMADMDIVNPFFRSVDAKAMLKALGIDVVAPLFANTNVDVPALVPEIATALRNPEKSIILDVGGDEDGARVLGRYHNDIPEDGYDMYLVINRARPLTRDADSVLEYMDAISASSRLKVTKLLSNTHFLGNTTPDDVEYGLELALQVSARTGVPVAATCVMEDLEPMLRGFDKTPLLVLRKNILLPF